jgi:hypothetical protein
MKLLRLLSFLLTLLMLAACNAVPPSTVIITATPAPVVTATPIFIIVTATPTSEASLTPSPTSSPSPVAFATNTNEPTPTREITRPTVDCGSYTIEPGWQVDNNNPCLQQPVANRVNPNDPADRNDQWRPSGYDFYWRRYTTISPIVNWIRRVDGVGVRYRVDVGYRDGEFGYQWSQHFYAPRECYLVKLTITTSLRPQPEVNDANWLASFSVAGRITSNSQRRELTAQSIQASGRQEFIWPVIAPDSAEIALFYRIQWPAALGEIVFEQIEILETPRGTSYCDGAGVTRFGAN